MIPFPLSEIYYHVLAEGWKIEEIWRRNGEIRVVAYLSNPAVDQLRKKTNMGLEDCLGIIKHLQFSLYED